MTDDHEAYLCALAAKARGLRAEAAKIDETLRQDRPGSTDWLGACDDEPAPPVDRANRWGDAALVFVGGIAGAVVGAWSCGGCQ